ncbi:hypothetical protein BD779DRAFT_1517818 [Infundibulicybe gibba]|nr:hypothetical protein BD779DRAFT_1517818 [Infundibulicybe gibba]
MVSTHQYATAGLASSRTTHPNYVFGPICPSCGQIEHRALKIASPTFRIPTARVIFVPSKDTPGESTCILCNMTVARDAQEFHLSGKHEGPRACLCSAPVVVRVSRPGCAPAIRDDATAVLRGRKKKPRCGQRSGITKIMRLGWQARPFFVNIPVGIHVYIGAHSEPGRLSSQRVRKQPRSRRSLLVRRPTAAYNGTEMAHILFAQVIGRKYVIWSNALNYISGFFQYPPPLFAERTDPEYKRPWESQTAPTHTTGRNVGKTGIEAEETEEIGARKPEKQQWWWWRCELCERSMPPSSMESHLQGGPHTRKATLAALDATARGVRSVRPYGRAQ